MGNRDNKSSAGGSALALIARFRLLVAAFVAAMLFVPASSAMAADVVANPGPFTATIGGGNLKVKDFDIDVSEIQPAPTLTGTMQPNGDFTIPSANVNFPPLQFELEGAQINVFILSTGTDWTGNLNPDTGLYTLNARIRIRADGNPLGISLGSSCFVGEAGTGNNIFLNPATSGTAPANPPAGAVTGGPYDPDTGKTTVVNNQFSVPGASGCGPLGLANGPVNDALGLPSSSGNNTLALELDFQPQFQPPAVARYTASPQIGRVPFDVDFDASASTSTNNGGVIDEYRWDFDGDGSVDEVTTDPTVTHTYETAGIYPTRLTIVSGDYQTTRSRATIEARAVITTFTETPPAFGQSRDATFAFVANEEGATFECRLDAGEDEGDWEACETPVELENLPDNDYTFLTRATVEGSTGLPASHEFRVDNIAPVATVSAKPANRVNGSITQGIVGFSSNEPGSTFECRYEPTVDPEAEPTEPAEFESCDSPTPVSWFPTEGTNTFDIRPTDRAGNVGNVTTATWTVDLTPPQANVLTSPPNPTNQIGGAYSEACDGTQIIICLGTVRERSTTGNLDQSYTFDANESGSTFVCQFNDGDERPCLSGVQTGTGVSGANNSFSFDELLRRLGNPVQGTNTFRVWAIDEAGNRQPNPTVSTFVYDNVRPVITALSGPANFTKNTTNTVIFESNEPVQANSFQCRFINNTGTGTTSFATGTGAATGFVPCDPGQLSPTLGWYSVAGQTEGRKGLQVRATDLAGNFHNTNNEVLNNGGLTRYWTVDNTAPTVTFAAGSQQQNSFTLSTSATINLTAADTPINFGTTANGIPAQTPSYECSLNMAAFSACTTPVQLTDLTPGAKSLRVRVTDAATNVSTIIERNWTVVDSSNASVELTSTPPAVSGVRDATFEFTPDDGDAECRLDPTEAQNLNQTGWVACDSGVQYTGLADGNHTVQIRDDASSIPAIYNWAVYANLPTTAVTQRPGILRPAPNAGYFTGLSTNSGQIEFNSPANPAYAPGATTHECRYYIDGATPPAFAPCTSPQNVSWNALVDNQTRVFEIRPTSSTGNQGSVTTLTWTTVATAPAVALGNENGVVTTACGTGVLGGPGPIGCVATANSTQPAPLSNVAAPRFQASSSKPIPNVIGYACQLNNGIKQNPCTARTSGFPAGGAPLTVLVNGTARGNNDNLGNAAQGGAIIQNAQNTLRIWAVDLGGNESAPVEYTWTHDNTAPGFSITSPTPARTSAEDVTVDILANEAISADADGFKCRLIPNATPTTNATATAGWPNCTTRVDSDQAQWVGEDLAEGTYALDIRGYDLLRNFNNLTTAAGRPVETNNNVNGRRYFFTVDRTAPVTSITGGPAEASTVGFGSGEFTFTTNEPATTASSECRLDPEDPMDLDEGWQDCDSPYQFEGLEDGEHVFQVRSTDDLGNAAVNPATRTWSIDSTKPTIELSSDLSGDLTNQDSIAIEYMPDPADADIECRLIVPAEEPGEGEEPVEVLWTDDCGELIVPEAPEPDPEDPEAELPPADDPYYSLSYGDLADGDYTFEIRATNGLGVESDVESLSWTVDTVGPETTINSGPTGNTQSTDASFGFSSNEAGSTFECQLDGGSFEACTSPKAYSNVAIGEHTFSVRATDAAGNTGDADSRTWTVQEVVAPCPDGTTGTPPDCIPDPPVECPDGQTGTPPNCVTPPPAECTPPQTGTPPNCVNPPQPGPGVLTQQAIRAPKSARVGRPYNVRARIRNTGESALTQVRVCLRTPKRFVAGKANRCRTVQSIAAGQTRVVQFRIRTRANNVRKGQRIRVRVIASAPGQQTRNRGHVTVLK